MAEFYGEFADGDFGTISVSIKVVNIMFCMSSHLQTASCKGKIATLSIHE